MKNPFLTRNKIVLVADEDKEREEGEMVDDHGDERMVVGVKVLLHGPPGKNVGVPVQASYSTSMTTHGTHKLDAVHIPKLWE